MSDKVNNYIEETKPLFRLLRTEAFRFIIIRYNHYSLINQLKEDLLHNFPDRPQNSVDARNTDYRSLVDSYYNTARGFFYIENFDEILANPEIYSGLNQRRDKLALYPIALIVFISSSTEELFARQIMEKMPDLWSFRSLLLDLKGEISQPVQSENWYQSFVAEQVTTTTTTTLGGSTPEEKEQELNRLLKRVSEVQDSERNLLIILYQQIAKILEDLRRFEEAIVYYLKLEKLEIENRDSVALGTINNNIGGLYAENGDWELAFKYYLIAEQMFLTNSNDEGLGATYNNISGYYINNSDWKKALSFLIKSEKGRMKSRDRKGLATTYFNLGFVYSKLRDLRKALEYYLKSEKLLLEFDNTEMLKLLLIRISEVYSSIKDWSKAIDCYQKLAKIEQKVGNKKGIGEALNYLGLATSNMGDFNKALEIHHQAERIRYEIGDDSGLIQTLYNIGMEWLRIKNAEKAVDYFTLAGYTAMKKGKDLELTQMDWAIRELIKKHGQDGFMKIGKELYDSWIKHLQ